MERIFDNNRRRTHPIFWLIVGALAGGVTAYLFDPARGKARRARAVNKVRRYKNEFIEYESKFARDLKNRAQGMIAEASHLFEADEPVDDQKLLSRVRSQFGRAIRHPRAIEVAVEEGVVTLSGPILREELEDLLRCVECVTGVQALRNELVVYDSIDDLPSFQRKGFLQ